MLDLRFLYPYLLISLVKEIINYINDLKESTTFYEYNLYIKVLIIYQNLIL